MKKFTLGLKVANFFFGLKLPVKISPLGFKIERKLLFSVRITWKSFLGTHFIIRKLGLAL